MRKVAWQIAGLFMALLLVCGAVRLAMANTYYSHVPLPEAQLSSGELKVVLEVPGVVSPDWKEDWRGKTRLTIRPEQPGDTLVYLYDQEGELLSTEYFHVTPLMTVYDASNGGFTGDAVVIFAASAFALGVAFLMLRFFIRAKGPAFYSYSTMYAAGFSIFALLTGLTLLYAALRHVLRPEQYTMLDAYTAITRASYSFMILTLPFMLAFAVSMAVSNAALMRHEGFALKNALGIAVGAALVAGEALGLYLLSRNFAGSEFEMRVRNTLDNAYATVFAYWECMLIGAIICGIKAARHVPAMDREYLIILGCYFRKDGTLPPLLRGRVDRALDFWKAQKERTGLEAVLVPSGGQGKNETMAEAEAMRRYMLSQGVPERMIRMEDQSKNTFQNMRFSREIIGQEAKDAKVGYVTTNYHVFRSGVWASRAGLPAEGIGSRTKWWYWPNAFMRECAGLLRNRIRQELVILAGLLVLFGLLSMALV